MKTYINGKPKPTIPGAFVRRWRELEREHGDLVPTRTFRLDAFDVVRGLGEAFWHVVIDGRGWHFRTRTSGLDVADPTIMVQLAPLAAAILFTTINVRATKQKRRAS